MKFYKQNLKGWAKGKSPLFITGISGSGKTTLASQLADRKNEVFHIDSIFAFARFTREEILKKYATLERELNKVFKDFVNSVPDEYFLYRTIDNDQEVCDKSLYLFHEFLSRLEAAHLTGHRYIIEGFPIYLDDPEYYRGKPLIVMTESYVKCAFRAYNRDKNTKSANAKYDGTNWRRILFKKRILMMFSKKNIHFRQLKTYRSFLRKIKEQNET